MDAAAVSLHHHPLPASLPPPPHHHTHCRTLPIPIPHTTNNKRPPVSSSAAAARPTNLTALPARSAPHTVLAAAAAPRCSSRAATGYAAALADACVRAGTLRRAFRDARAILSSEECAGKKLDERVAALVRMLARKGRDGMVAEVMAEFAAICDHLLPRPARAH